MPKQSGGRLMRRSQSSFAGMWTVAVVDVEGGRDGRGVSQSPFQAVLPPSRAVIQGLRGRGWREVRIGQNV